MEERTGNIRPYGEKRLVRSRAFGESRVERAYDDDT